jgi:hypothetical protein
MPLRKVIGLAEMKLGFWESEIIANPISTFLSSGSPLSKMRLATPRDQHYVTDSSRVYKRSQSSAFNFYSTDAHSTGFHGHDSLARSVA